MYLNKPLFLYLFFGFVFAAIAGTLAHEFGHYAAAELVGAEAEIHYGSMSLADSSGVGDDNFIWIRLGGPIQTILTGLSGCLLLYIYRKKFTAEPLMIGQWVMIFLALFWLRQGFNFATWIFHGFDGRGDEIGIARHYGFPEWSILVATGIISAAVLLIITTRFVPARDRLTFVLAGLTGGIAGFLVWFEGLGELILP